MKIVLKILLVFTYSALSHAMTLDEIRSLAVSNSMSLKARDLESHALENEKELKGKWQNPQLMGQVGSLKSGSITGSTVEVSLTQPVPISNKYSLRKELAELALKSQLVEKNYFINWVEHQALLSAWKVLIAKELYSHGIERAARIKIIQKYLATHPKVSIRQKVEQSIIESLVLQLLKMQDEKKHELAQAEKELEFWIGKPITAQELKVSLPDDEKVVIPHGEKRKSDNELVIAQNQMEISRLDAELAGKERRPDLYLGGGYRVENVEPQNHFSYAIVGLNIPIWDTGSSRLEAARAREKRDQKFFEEMERRVNLKHQKQEEMVQFYLSQIKRFPKKLLKEQENSIHQAEAGFKQGLVDVNTFLLSETQTHDVIDQIFISWMGYLDNLSSLQLMRGEKFAWHAK
jgi:hypothetical protein